jgi:osmotically-inducible protein OsmY
VEHRSKEHLVRFTTAFIFGAGTAFFLDPRLGKQRRHGVRDRVLRLLRHSRDQVLGRAKFAVDHAQGLAAEAVSSVARTSRAADDETVKSRVLSNALRHVPVANSELDVEVADGVVTLRGSIASKTLADDLVERVRAVPGVRAVTPELTVAHY